jgi:peptide/nickel transport system substrate-binding protein
MYRPLYMFGNNGLSTLINYPLSLATPPVYKGSTVVINLKGWKWSNGETIDAKDVIFWLNMMRAEKANFAGYSPGQMPDDLVNYQATGPDQVTMRLNQSYSTFWFTYNQLAEITPMPMAWDVTRMGAPQGSGGCTSDSAADKWAKCKAVFAFLTSQAKATSAYASSQVWDVVDGPWKLSTFSTDGDDEFVPNRSYSGEPKPSISALKLEAFTSDSTEYIALRSGQLDVGYIPPDDLVQRLGAGTLPAVNPVGRGYNLQPFYSYSINYYQPNLNNPAIGAAFRQLYVRQALESVADQAGVSRTILRGYGYPTAGPVPQQPANPWVPGIQMLDGGAGPYPFNPVRARLLLESHGWRLVHKVMTCEGRCGRGIAAGTQLKFTLDYANGAAATTQEMEVYKSDASLAGIDVNVVGQSFNTVVGEGVPCKPGPKCSWQAIMYGGWAFDGPGFEPTGEPLFQSGAPNNAGSYSNPIENSLIAQTHTNSSMSVFHAYATFTAQQLPIIFMPNSYAIEAVTTHLHNVTFDPVYTFLPEYWYFTK